MITLLSIGGLVMLADEEDFEPVTLGDRLFFNAIVLGIPAIVLVTGLVFIFLLLP